jgi:hypothetical protein
MQIKGQRLLLERYSDWPRRHFIGRERRPHQRRGAGRKEFAAMNGVLVHKILDYQKPK